MLSSLILSLVMSGTPATADVNTLNVQEVGTKRGTVRIGTKRGTVRIEHNKLNVDEAGTKRFTVRIGTKRGTVRI